MLPRIPWEACCTTCESLSYPNPWIVSPRIKDVKLTLKLSRFCHLTTQMTWILFYLFFQNGNDEKRKARQFSQIHTTLKQELEEGRGFCLFLSQLCFEHLEQRLQHNSQSINIIYIPMRSSYLCFYLGSIVYKKT